MKALYGKDPMRRPRALAGAGPGSPGPGRRARRRALRPDRAAAAQALSGDGAVLYAARYTGRARGFEFTVYACRVAGGNESESCAPHGWGGAASLPEFVQVG